MSGLQQAEKNMIFNDPLFQRIFIFIIGLIIFFLNVGGLGLLHPVESIFLASNCFFDMWMFCLYRYAIYVGSVRR